jgi:hypothetical protein
LPLRLNILYPVTSPSFPSSIVSENEKMNEMRSLSPNGAEKEELPNDTVEGPPELGQ